MNCPNDGTALALSNRSGIEIDYCPQCRGVWLDRGELDKILERESDLGQSAYGGYGNGGSGHGGYGGHGGDHGGGQGNRGGRRRGGLLGELFG